MSITTDLVISFIFFIGYFLLFRLTESDKYMLNYEDISVMLCLSIICGLTWMISWFIVPLFYLPKINYERLKNVGKNYLYKLQIYRT